MLDLITDRTQADVDARNNKGTYNSADLNRVTVAMEYLVEELRNMGYLVEYDTIFVDGDRTIWNEKDNPTAGQLSRYLSNVNKIRSTLAEIKTNPPTPETMELLTYSKANDIEKILKSIEIMVENMKHSANLGWILGIADIGLYGGV